MPKPSKVVGQAVESSGLSLRAFASALFGVDKTTLVRWINGSSPVPLAVLMICDEIVRDPSFTDYYVKLANKVR